MGSNDSLANLARTEAGSSDGPAFLLATLVQRRILTGEVPLPADLSPNRGRGRQGRHEEVSVCLVRRGPPNKKPSCP
jgi:hypothetical protein